MRLIDLFPTRLVELDPAIIFTRARTHMIKWTVSTHSRLGMIQFAHEGLHSSGSCPGGCQVTYLNAISRNVGYLNWHSIQLAMRQQYRHLFPNARAYIAVIIDMVSIY